MSFDCNTPIHVHMRRDDNEAKSWLEPIEITFSHGFPERERRDIKDPVVLGEREKAPRPPGLHS